MRTAPRAHPRSRGADEMSGTRGTGCPGSSPLARGGHPGASVHDLVEGLIPARAGRTATARGGSTCARAHPRSRGADSSSSVARSPTTGSSPLARGGPTGAAEVARAQGLIPARAGRTMCVRGRCMRRGAHPRSRGADVVVGVPGGRIAGSSPLARGGPEHLQRAGQVRGLIPARAGRTPSTPRATWPGRAHPRSRGADPITASRMSAARGSSPLARGGLPPDGYATVAGGLIPARAGRTLRDPCISKDYRAAAPRLHSLSSTAILCSFAESWPQS